MSLNQLILNSSLLADLYPDVLVEINATRMPEPGGNKYLGSNEKNILIVVNTADAVYLDDAELTFLTNILSACNLSLADVAIVNWYNKETALFVSEFKSKHVILFGISPLQFDLPINFPHFQIQNFDKTDYLTAPALSIISNDVSVKKELWTSLKKMFNI
jgi:hypothetical protein